MKRLLLLLSAVWMVTSCNKEQKNARGDVAIYLLKNVQLVANKCQVDAAHAAIETLPLVANGDILEYNQSNYEFKLAPSAIQKVKGLADRTPFAMTVNKEVIYYGFFKPSISSSSCEHSITMDISWSAVDKIMIRLGYPGPVAGVPIDDKRNDPRLLNSLEQQQKLR